MQPFSALQHLLAKIMNFEDVFHDYSEDEFLAHALKLFGYQYSNNQIYYDFCCKIHKNPSNVTALEKIPFLPISFFKTHTIKTTDFTEEKIFYSSGTTGNNNAKHFVKSLDLYTKSFVSSFERFYGSPAEYTFLALLPNYLEQGHSSLIYMMQTLINLSSQKQSGFYLYNYEDLYNQLIDLQNNNKKTILFGVSYALLDFARKYRLSFPELIVFETGGMKGRGKEMVKEELHAILKNCFGVSSIHSEYGMCELMSQAYSKGENLFSSPPWMRLILRDEKDPFNLSSTLASGIINVIDFANCYSCAFIATDDIGKRNGSQMELLGRCDDAQIRGCNLLIMS